jgi:hypothetical protein
LAHLAGDEDHQPGKQNPLAGSSTAIKNIARTRQLCPAGLGVGHGPVALLLTGVIAILVGYLAVTRKDVEDPKERRPSRQPPKPRPDEDKAAQTAWGFFMWDE